jgi:alpha-beta hydrolase superfamily lysophospholipase
VADGIQIKESRLKTSDGEEIGTWYVSGQSNRPVVLLIHGNGGDRMSCWPRAEFLIREGYPVLLMTCRAHGDSTGKTNDFGYSARHDVIAAVDWLKKQDSQRNIVIWGASLGSAAAIFASEALDQRVQGYILECPYRDLATACWNRLDNSLPPILDLTCYLGMRLTALVLLPDFAKISPYDHMTEIPDNIPVLILAGGADTRAHPAEARALHDRIANHSQLEIIENAEHLKLMQTAPDQYQRLILNCLRSIESARGSHD